MERGADEKRAGARERPVLVGAIVAAALTVVLALWIGRPCLGGWWIADTSVTADTYMIATIYERWAEQVRGGGLPLWMPEFAAGHPVHAAWMYGFLYPPFLLFAALPVESAWAWVAILHAVFGAVGVYALLWDERRDTAAAASGAVVFGLSGFVLGRIECGHVNLVTAYAWAPWVLRAATRVARGERGATAVLGFCGGMGLLAGHVQIWFYVGPLVLAWALLEARRRATLGGTCARLVAAAAIALAVSAVQWVPAAELFLVSNHPPPDPRLVELCSATPAALAAQIAPRFLASGEPWTHEMVGLAGPLSVFAGLLAFRLRDPRRWFWLGVFALGVFLALGAHSAASAAANDLPPFRWGRSPPRALMLTVLAAAVLSGHVVADWCGAWRTALRALVPAAFVASALFFGMPAPASVRSDFFDFDWTRALPPEARAHRVHVIGWRYPYFERFGVATVRPVATLDTSGSQKLLAGETASAAWWLDIGAEFETPWPGGPPPDGAATEEVARASRVRTLRSAGHERVFARAFEASSDEEIVAKLHLGERELWIDVGGDAPLGTAGASPPRITGAERPSASRMLYTFGAGDPAWLFVSEKWYPGWEFRQDGGPWRDAVRGNLAFLAVPVSPGTVELRYRPGWLWPSLIVSLAGLVAAALGLIQARR